MGLAKALEIYSRLVIEKKKTRLTEHKQFTISQKKGPGQQSLPKQGTKNTLCDLIPGLTEPQVPASAFKISIWCFTLHFS